MRPLTERRSALLFKTLPRSPTRKLMYVCDAGSGLVKFECRNCGYRSEWLLAGKLSDDKRGRLCPRCNLNEMPA